MANVVDTATSYIGKVRYQFGADNIDGGTGDCSAFTQTVYKKATGIDIGRTSINQSTVGREVKKEELQAGDLIIFKNTYRTGPSHTGIYIGENKFIHNSDNGVTISDLNSNYYTNHYMTARRINGAGGSLTATTLSNSNNVIDNVSNDTEDVNLFGNIVVVVVVLLVIALGLIFFTKAFNIGIPSITSLTNKMGGTKKNG